MVFDGSYQTNFDDNIVAVEWVIHCIDTDGYAWLYILTTPQVLNAYISELIGLYSILALLESVC